MVTEVVTMAQETMQEGVTKFLCEHTSAPLPPWDIGALLRARHTLAIACLVGADSDRYEGVGFGNVSVRTEDDAFLITGTQTGAIAELQDAHLAWVEEASPNQNAVWSRGPTRPSSESMTHAVIYAERPTIQAVAHVHSPEIWHARAALRLPETGSDIPYGTPEMARAVTDLVRNPRVIAFAMAGHEDGIVTLGDTPEQATLRALALLEAARRSDSMGGGRSADDTPSSLTR
ncbi:MAG: L-ribulose-5-phosphate 4-epimerase [Bradymonadia bacterium]|jgi:L-ribulose-5-phosphate 4-epimerase